MNMQRGFGNGFTKTGKTLLTVYGIIYLMELITEHWLGIHLVNSLVLHPMGSPDFRAWQLFTHPFIHDPGQPLGFLLNALVLYFFMAPVEHALGRKNFLTLYFLSAAGAALAGFALSGLPGFGTLFFGMMPSLLTLVVVFGLLNPEATILLMFVIPVRAKYLSYGTIAITLLTFLARANPAGAYHLGGMLAGYLYFRGPADIRNHLQLKYLQYQHKKKMSKFHVIRGGRDEKGNDDKPTIH